MAFGHFLCKLSQFHGHGSWLVCQVALSLLFSISSLAGHNFEDLRRKNKIPNNDKITGTLEFSLALTKPILSQGFAKSACAFWNLGLTNGIGVYWVMVEGYPNLKEEVGGSNLGCEISSLLDGKLARWSTASCAWRWPVGLLSQKKKKKDWSQWT